jgi:hypothetical protein
MSTATAHTQRSFFSGRRFRLALLAAFALAALSIGHLDAVTNRIDPELLEGRAPTAEELMPSVEAAFQSENYKPGDVASLKLFSNVRGVTFQVFHTGPETTPTVGNTEMQGIPVTQPRSIGNAVKGQIVHFPVGNWPSGVYFAKLNAKNGLVGYAPVIITPSRLGESKVAVVMPTMTWQAYNIRDDNGDGKGDSWYANWAVHTAHLYRPYLDRGVPYHFRGYDLPFLHWLAWNSKQVDFLSDGALDAVKDPAQLAKDYNLIIFPGHHEYVTTHEYGIVRGYRDDGGNLAFLSANNFFWQIVRQGNTMTRTSQWRDLDLPEASLIGTSYRANDDGQHRGAWIVRDTDSAPWLFAGTGLAEGSTFGMGGIEIDKTSSASPQNVHVLAEIPDLLGPGLTAQMTYYSTPNGAKVFAAGAFTLAGQVISNPTVQTMISNLYDYLSQP